MPSLRCVRLRCCHAAFGYPDMGSSRRQSSTGLWLRPVRGPLDVGFPDFYFGEAEASSVGEAAGDFIVEVLAHVFGRRIDGGEGFDVFQELWLPGFAHSAQDAFQFA